MNVTQKRKIAARLLLAVFLPMLLLSSLHVHPSGLSADSCTECVDHHCGGHLGQKAPSLHDCVLCQLLTLPMLSAAVAVVAVALRVDNELPRQGRALRATSPAGTIVTRGPPACRPFLT